MKSGENYRLRIESISIENYKGIDKLDLEFPKPVMSDEPDISVMGSKNGLGKTSVMECCSLLLLAFIFDKAGFQSTFENFEIESSNINVRNLLIRGNSEYAKIVGEISLKDQKFTVSIFTVSITIYRNTRLEVLVKIQKTKSFLAKANEYRKKYSKELDNEEATELINMICGLTADPVIFPMFLLFHSYRKVQEGNPELGMMIENPRYISSRFISRRTRFGRRYRTQISAFKLIILRSLMERADLFELEKDRQSNETIQKLNDLLKDYTGGVIGKLRPNKDSTIEFRIMLPDSDHSFNFDGLSSGQKEIISTLFLIWHNTENQSHVVFIDEPELHLNPEWHKKFINHLTELAPNNQYIIATHSEDIMDSVSRKQRFLLSSKPDNK